MSDAAAPAHDPVQVGQRIAPEVVARLSAVHATVAVAESVTGGRLISTLTGVPGASQVVLGGVVAYATSVKASVLGVDAVLLAEQGPVCAEVAMQLAQGVRALLGADVGVATTGEAGPESGSGQPVGTVHLAVCGSFGQRSALLHLAGGRAEVQDGATRAALELLLEAVRGPVPQ